MHGRQIPVPADIGIGRGFMSPLHTHDATGLIHIESSERRPFTLGELFDVWGVRLTGSSLGGYRAGDDGVVRVFIDGRPADGDIRALTLEDQAVIVVTFGTHSEVPRPVPSTFVSAG